MTLLRGHGTTTFIICVKTDCIRSHLRHPIVFCNITNECV